MILYLSFMPWHLLKHINDLVLCIYQNTLTNLKNPSTTLKIMEQRCQTISCLMVCQLKTSKEQLTKATISDLHRNLMKEQLKKIVTCHLPVLTRSQHQGRVQWKQKKQINLNVIQIQMLKISSTHRVAVTKTTASLNLLTMLKRKPSNLNYTRGPPKAKTH